MIKIANDAANELWPSAFDSDTIALAVQLKQSGLSWEPRVGSFVHDPDGLITSPSPFPNRVYMVLNLDRFLKIFGSRGSMKKHLVWLPTWHQARMLCRVHGVPDPRLGDCVKNDPSQAPGIELRCAYRLLADAIAADTGGGGDPALTGGSPEDQWIRGVIARELGDPDALPPDVRDRAWEVFSRFLTGYLGWLRSRTGRSANWLPDSPSLDEDVVNGMSHFFSDYQRLVREAFRMRDRVRDLQVMDPLGSPDAYQEQVNRILGDSPKEKSCEWLHRAIGSDES